MFGIFGLLEPVQRSSALAEYYLAHWYGARPPGNIPSIATGAGIPSIATGDGRGLLLVAVVF
jgi:hypothetical protein